MTSALLDTLHLIYHNVPRGDISYKYAVSSDLFRQHLAVIREKGSSSRFTGVITFDDGHRTQFEHAFPLLTEAGIKATFFITAGWTDVNEDSMTTAQLRELSAAGHTIGAHGLTHKWLTKCSTGELKTELGNARQELEDAIGQPVTAISIPGGRYDQRVLEACAREGYHVVFTSDPVTGIRRQSGVEIIGRYNVRNTISREGLRSVLDPESGVLRKEQRLVQIKGWAKGALGDRLYHRLWSGLNREYTKK